MKRTTAIKSEWIPNHTVLFEACRTMLEHGRDENSWNNLMKAVLRISIPRNLFDKTNAASGLSLIVTRAGSKKRELKPWILPNLPKYDRYFEPFVGGGSVFMGLNANEYFINDFSSDLVSIYKNISKSDDRFFTCIEKIDQSLLKADDFFKEKENELVDMYSKFYYDEDLEIGHMVEKWCYRTKAEIYDIVRDVASVEPNLFLNGVKSSLTKKFISLKKQGIIIPSVVDRDIRYSIKAAQFRYYRHIYNNQEITKTDDALHVALFFYILQFQYQGKEDYNKKGEFTSSYGGQTDKRLYGKLNYFRSASVKAHFENTRIYNLDFEEFLKTTNPTKDDFIFLDPPYDETFSSYGNHDFGREDHIRLANYLLTECKAKWMMIIKDTDFIYNLYNKSGIYIDAYNYQYKINKDGVTHLLITNYPLEDTGIVREVEYKSAA